MAYVMCEECEACFKGNISYSPQSPEECLAGFAEYVRIPLEEARTLADGWLAGVRCRNRVGRRRRRQGLRCWRS